MSIAGFIYRLRHTAESKAITYGIQSIAMGPHGFFRRFLRLVYEDFHLDFL